MEGVAVKAEDNQVDQREALMRIIPAQWVSKIVEQFFQTEYCLQDGVKFN